MGRSGRAATVESESLNTMVSWRWLPALFMKVRRESIQTRSEMSPRSREALRHTRAVCRRAERRDCLS